GQLQGHHADAFFFATQFTGLELADNLARSRKAIKAGLALFGVSAANSSAPAIKSLFFEDAEVREITEMCAGLLWLEADALAQVRIGEREEAVKGRIHQVLALLDRADSLLGEPAYAGQVRRAVCLERLGRKEEAALLRQRPSRVPP